MSAPALITMCSAVFDQKPKNGMTPIPHLPIHPILPQAASFVSPDEKSPQREMFS